MQLADMTNDTTNIAEEYAASCRFMHAERQIRPEKDVSIARRANRKNADGRPVVGELPVRFACASNIVNASLRKFWKPVMLEKGGNAHRLERAGGER